MTHEIFQNGAEEAPCIISLCYACNTIVMTIYGSLSVENVVVDEMFDPISLKK